jgi:hypothetical protein
MAYISGHTNAFWSATSGSASPSFVSLGSTESGWELIETQHDEPVVDDAFGMAQPDGIQQGKDHMLRLTYIEFDLSSASFYAQAAQGVVNTNVGIPMTALCGELCLMPVIGTPAATLLGTGKCYQFYKAICVSDIPTLLSSKLRKAPLNFRCYPDPTSGGTNGKVYAIVTAPSGVNGTNPTGPGA